MGRPRRVTTGGFVYHVLNRATARSQIFYSPADYQAFERLLVDARDRFNMRILAFCIMPNHWHMVLWPRNDNELSKFTGWLTLTHTQRWHACRNTAGEGHLYQGRYKSFLVESDAHLLTVCRYVERNAQRANLVQRAEDWRWCSLWHQHNRTDEPSALLDSWPVSMPNNWIEQVNQPQTTEELNALRNCVKRGQPFGSASWLSRTVAHYDLQSTLRNRGRPPTSGGRLKRTK
jgi:putative transposase